MNVLSLHKIVLQSTLRGEKVVLRSITESDWDILLKWNNDPQILYYSEGDDITSCSLAQVQYKYRLVCQNAFCFIIEIDSKPVGDCSLQQMNLERVLKSYPELDCRRLDLMIGERSYWGRGIGTKVILMLTEFGFFKEDADMIFGCDIADYNLASLKAFHKAGFRIVAKIEQPPGSKSHYNYDVALSRKEFLMRKDRDGSEV